MKVVFNEFFQSESKLQLKFRKPAQREAMQASQFLTFLQRVKSKSSNVVGWEGFTDPKRTRGQELRDTDGKATTELQQGPNDT